MKIHVAAATSREDGYFCLLLRWVSYGTPTPCGRVVHRCNIGKEISGFPMTNSGPRDGPASVAAAGEVVTSSMLMTTASKASCLERCCAMATGVCQVDLST